MWSLTVREVGLELGRDFCAVLGENRVGQVGDRHFWAGTQRITSGCAKAAEFTESHNADRGQIAALFVDVREFTGAHHETQRLETARILNISWSFLNFAVSHSWLHFLDGAGR